MALDNFITLSRVHRQYVACSPTVDQPRKMIDSGRTALPKLSYFTRRNGYNLLGLEAFRLGSVLLVPGSSTARSK